MNNKGVWCTLLGTENYLTPIIGLYYSYQKINSKYPFLVMAVENLPQKVFDELEKENINYKKIPFELFSGHNCYARNYDITFGKFYSFLLDDYDFFCFIDGDCIFLENIDYLLDQQQISYFISKTEKNLLDTRGCIFVNKPSEEIFEYCKSFQMIYGCDEQILEHLRLEKLPGVNYVYSDFNKNNLVLYRDSLTLVKDKYWNIKNYNFIDFYTNLLIKKQRIERDKAWCTLLTSIDYLEAVLALNNSLHLVKSKYPLVVACTEEIYSQKKILEIFNKEDILFEKINKINYSKKTIEDTLEEGKNLSVLNTASKIEIFNLTNYNKLVYIDADTFFVKNADELFDYKDGSIIMENEKTDDVYWGFSGLMVVNPKNHYFKMYYSLLQNNKTYDGDMFGKLWFHVRDNKDYQIPLEIYLSPLPLDGNIGKKVKIYHMVGDSKLWKKRLYKDNEIERYYKSLLFYSKLTYFNN